MPEFKSYTVNDVENNAAYPLIAIDGPGGAGKSTLGNELARRFGFTLLHGDDYFEPSDTSRAVPGQLNLNRFISDAGTMLTSGAHTITVRPYNWTTRTIAEQHLPVERGVIFEGIKAFSLPLPWDFRVWMDAPLEVREYRCVYMRTDQQRKAPGKSTAELIARFHTWAHEAETYEHDIRAREIADCVLDGMVEVDGHLAKLHEAGILSNTEFIA